MQVGYLPGELISLALGTLELFSNLLGIAQLLLNVFGVLRDEPLLIAWMKVRVRVRVGVRVRVRVRVGVRVRVKVRARVRGGGEGWSSELAPLAHQLRIVRIIEALRVGSPCAAADPAFHLIHSDLRRTRYTDQ